MREFFPLVFSYQDKSHFCYWYSDEDDGFLVNGKKLIKFDSLNEMIDFAKIKGINLNLESEIPTIFIHDLQKLFHNRDNLLDCQCVLEFWNISGDLAHSLDISFYGDDKKPIISKIYDKLFWGNNLTSMTPIGKTYLPEWEPNELEEISKVIQDGLKVVINAL